MHILSRHCHTHNRGTEGGHYPGQPQAKCLVQQHKYIFLRLPCRYSNREPLDSEAATLPTDMS